MATRVITQRGLLWGLVLGLRHRYTPKQQSDGTLCERYRIYVVILIHYGCLHRSKTERLG